MKQFDINVDHFPQMRHYHSLTGFGKLRAQNQIDV